MSLESIYALSEPDSAFFKRVVVAVAQTAEDVRNEDPGTANHNNRVKWQRNADADPESMARRMVWRFLENPTLQSAGDASTDSDILFVAASLVDTFAALM